MSYVNKHWDELNQHTIDAAIIQWQSLTACAESKGHFEHLIKLDVSKSE